MLIVRRAQLDALGDHARRKFVATVLAHLKKHFPERCAALGDPAVRHLIDDGIAKAGRFDLTVEQDVAGLIHFMFEAGPEFDQRPAFGWAVQVLGDRSAPGSERIDRLFDEWPAHRAKHP